MTDKKRHEYEVILTEYSSDWIPLYDETSETLAKSLAGVDFEIEAVGSRVVPELWSKPVLDIMIRVPDEARDQVDQVVTGMGLTRLNIEELGGRTFYRRWGADGNPDLHIHVVDEDQWRNSHERIFRDRLLENRDLALAYSHMKRWLLDLSGGDAKAYSRAKNEFIRCLDTILNDT
ncbi:hypothetical protein Aph01nite_62320 [Acrocarpospora phusangensis]|uniref:GrpB family protein n=1 Tax=Acrocarpospora phusangensis TaxID=1070424 RepID=A0A919QFD2_9ACTN|nr:GrpB family protein [Acrocarpospora phusangensis]GIH27922.1 hypothetical protein Aph01nite_62320 [Acrocarpospora phusangensis]